MSRINKFIRLFSISPRIALSKVLDTFLNKFKNKKLKEKYITSNFYTKYPFQPEQKLYNFIKLNNLDELHKYKDVFKKLTDNFISHNFNLLGSGWKNVNLSNESKINSNYSNHSEQYKIKGLIDKNYTPIDWHIDFKSGYRWDESTFYKDIKFGNVLGADIKIPWELGRMQHLPVFAYTYKITNDKVKESDIYKIGYQNQILDFISSNPPGFGVQWSSSMDTAIRAVNWMLSYSIFKDANCEFPAEFDYYFIKSIYEHGRHIVENLEWSSGMRGNHYLANLTGLIFIASHLPESEETNIWLVFAINEFCNEILYQFNEDGSNFEASTNYHCFASEMVFCTLDLIYNLPDEKIQILKKQDGNYYNFITKNYSINAGFCEVNNNNRFTLNEVLIIRLYKIYEFSSAIININSLIPQFGDNDSGQLLISNYKSLSRDNLNLLSVMKDVLNKINNELINNIFNTENIRKSYNDFGLFILNNNKITIFIRCGNIGQKGKGGHSHNDQLSFELFIDNKAVIVDPGTYVYTVNPELRNEYRSTKLHNTLWIEGYEQNEWDKESVDDLFWIKKDRTKARMIEFSAQHFIGEHYGFPKQHRREILIEDTIITGTDVCDLNKTSFISFHFAPCINLKKDENNNVIFSYNNKIIKISCLMFKNINIEKYFYSPGYGERVEAEKLLIEIQNNRIEWQIEIKSE